MLRRRLVAAGAAGTILLGLATGTALANEEAIEEIDLVVHEWEDGGLDAEVAMEEIDFIVHDVPSEEREGLLVEIDALVHAWGDGEIEAAEALEEIEALIHGAHESDEDEHGDDAQDDAAPAATGNAGLRATGGPDAALVALGGLSVALLVGASRVATARSRK